jgi:hypothetical protein
MRESWRSYPRLTLTCDKLYNILSLNGFVDSRNVFPFKMTGLYNVTYHSIITDTLVTSDWVKIIILSNLKFHLLLQVIKKFVVFFGTRRFPAVFTRTPYWGKLIPFATPFQNITILICTTSRTAPGSIPGGVTGDFFRGSPRRNLVPWGRLSPWIWVPGIYPRVKAAGAYGWRPTTL